MVDYVCKRPLVTPAEMAFGFTGADQYWTVPDGVTSIEVELWGAGGGTNGYNGHGGGGGYAATTLGVTPGQQLLLVVGEGGATSPQSGGGQTQTPYGGGGLGAGTHGNGGGLSGIFHGEFTQARALVIAAGGGGGGDQINGGAGGGAQGQSSSGGVGGAGAEQAGAGNSGTAHGGAALSGGSTDQTSGGGGGAGYFGGAAGTGGNPRGEGGGGSGYLASGIGVLETGDYGTPGRVDDPDRQDAGQGGNPATQGSQRGRDGRIVIRYASERLPAPDGSEADNASTTCAILHAAHPNLSDGLYWLDPDGVGDGQPFEAYCDMETDGGGWTLVAALANRWARSAAPAPFFTQSLIQTSDSWTDAGEGNPLLSPADRGILKVDHWAAPTAIRYQMVEVQTNSLLNQMLFDDPDSIAHLQEYRPERHERSGMALAHALRPIAEDRAVYYASDHGTVWGYDSIFGRLRSDNLQGWQFGVSVNLPDNQSGYDGVHDDQNRAEFNLGVAGWLYTSDVSGYWMEYCESQCRHEDWADVLEANAAVVKVWHRQAAEVICEGDYTVDSTNTVDGMAAIADCTVITGNLWIHHTTLTDLDDLAGLTSVSGFVSIELNYSLTHVDGLSSLSSVGGYLSLKENTVLMNLNGLSNLTSVNGELWFHGNTLLCQGKVDEFISRCTTCGAAREIDRNNDSCSLN